jgi:glyoxylase-like metal-dependent hydrolase (beta-lactamase superfamily II)
MRELQSMEPITPIQQRELPHPILENIWMWSIFSEEKQLYFNGYALKSPQGVVIIDPPSAGEAIFAEITRVGSPVLVIITNRDHERESNAFHKHFHIPVAAPALDAPLLEKAPEIIFQDGEMLQDSLQVIHLPHQKSPGESALYLSTQKLLFLGDALIGKPTGQLQMLPSEKYADCAKAREGLNRLPEKTLEIDSLLLGDGEPILNNGQAALHQFFSNHP